MIFSVLILISYSICIIIFFSIYTLSILIVLFVFRLQVMPSEYDEFVLYLEGRRSMENYFLSDQFPGIK